MGSCYWEFVISYYSYKIHRLVLWVLEERKYMPFQWRLFSFFALLCSLFLFHVSSCILFLYYLFDFFFIICVFCSCKALWFLVDSKLLRKLNLVFKEFIYLFFHFRIFLPCLVLVFLSFLYSFIIMLSCRFFFYFFISLLLLCYFVQIFSFSFICIFFAIPFLLFSSSNSFNYTLSVSLSVLQHILCIC